jgi:hypothetical protein
VLLCFGLPIQFMLSPVSRIGMNPVPDVEVWRLNGDLDARND